MFHFLFAVLQGVLLGVLVAFALLFMTISPFARRLRERVYLWRLRRLAGRLRAVMVAATAVQILDRPGGFQYAFNFQLDPGNIAAGGREVETVAVPGAQIGDCVTLCPRYASGLVIGYTRVSAAGVVTFTLENNTAGALDEGAQQWDGILHRGNTGPLR